MISARPFLLAIATAVAVAPAPAVAQNVTPMVYDLAPEGRGAARKIEFWNSQNRGMAVEVKVARRTFDADGQPIDSPAAPDFEIIPSQFIVGAGEREQVRIRYVGDKAIDRSTTYAISFRQVPIEGAKADPKLRFLFDFKTIANVVPEGAKPDIVIELAVADGNIARVTFANLGKSYGRIDSEGLRLGSGADALQIDPATLRDRFNLRWITPGATRTADIPLTTELVGPIAAERVAPVTQ